MDYTNHNTTLRTNKHLNLEERFYVEKRIAAGDSVTAIATVLGRSRTTIYTELKRGSVVQIRQGKACIVYVADSGQLTYEQQRLGSFNTMKLGSIESFILWVEEKVDYINHPFNMGYAKAVQTGIKYAYYNNYDYAIQFDADGQHLASEANKLFEKLKKKNCDIVIGSRFLKNTGYKHSFFRKLGTNLFTQIIKIYCKKVITDPTSNAPMVVPIGKYKKSFIITDK